MDVEQKKDGKLALKMKIKDRNEDDHSLDRGLFLPLIKNETKQERANRILAMMEASQDAIFLLSRHQQLYEIKITTECSFAAWLNGNMKNGSLH